MILKLDIQDRCSHVTRRVRARRISVQQHSKRYYSTVPTNKADPSPAPPLVERCGPTFRRLRMGGDGAERTRGDPRRERPVRLHTETTTCLTSSSPPQTWSDFPDHVRVRLDTHDCPPPSTATTLAAIDAAPLGPNDEPATAPASEAMTPRCRWCNDDAMMPQVHRRRWPSDAATPGATMTTPRRCNSACIDNAATAGASTMTPQRRRYNDDCTAPTNEPTPSHAPPLFEGDGLALTGFGWEEKEQGNQRESLARETHEAERGDDAAAVVSSYIHVCPGCTHQLPRSNNYTITTAPPLQGRRLARMILLPSPNSNRSDISNLDASPDLSATSILQPAAHRHAPPSLSLARLLTEPSIAQAASASTARTVTTNGDDCQRLVQIHARLYTAPHPALFSRRLSSMDAHGPADPANRTTPSSTSLISATAWHARGTLPCLGWAERVLREQGETLEEGDPKVHHGTGPTTRSVIHLSVTCYLPPTHRLYKETVTLATSSSSLLDFEHRLYDVRSLFTRRDCLLVTTTLQVQQQRHHDAAGTTTMMAQ
ncbi:hypothetical protein BDZ97DRAFT_1978108 [Flammula alnicola]|nr:hypothetical protein BDZ97DRAFT_1978108 [Flammula alnicola]